MNKIFNSCLGVALGLMCVCCSEKKETDLDTMNLKGKVVAVTDSIWTAIDKFGEVQKEELAVIQKNEFNSEGNLISYTVYDEDHSIINKRVFDYKNDKTTIKEYNSEGKLTGVNTTLLSEDGNVLEELYGTFEGDDTNGRTKYFYKENRVDSLVTKDGLDTYFIKNEYLDKNGSYRQIWTKSDGEDKKIEIIHRKDNKGREISIEFDDVKNIVEYNENGDICRTSQNSEVNTMEYVYDDHKNWIRKVTLEENEVRGNKTFSAKSITVRTIQYK